MTTSVPTFPCPGCGAPVIAGTTRCQSCRLWLVGELAAQLWQLDQHLSAVHAQRVRMIDALRAEEPAASPVGTPSAPTVRPVAGSGAWNAGSPAAPRPGVETRTVLLWLGAGCLTAALVAGTALIWSSLGATGQTAVMLLITAVLLGGAVRLRRLPATAEALAAVGVASLAIDLIAGRTLKLSWLSGLDPRGYWVIVSIAATLVLGVVAKARPALVSPTVGAATAAFGAVLAIVGPKGVDAWVLVAVLELLAAVAVLRINAVLGLQPTALRITSSIAALLAVVVGTISSLLAAAQHDSGTWGVVALALVIALLPELDPGDWPVDGVRVAAMAGGLLTAAVGLIANASTVDDHALGVAALAVAALAGTLVAPRRPMALHRAALAVGAAATLTTVVAEARLQHSVAEGGSLVAAGWGVALLAAIAVVVAVRVAEPLRSAASAVAAAAGLIAVAQVSAAHNARVAGVATAIAASGLCVGALAMRRWQQARLLHPSADAVALVGAVSATLALFSLGDYVVSLGAVAGALGVASFASAALLTDDRAALRWVACALGAIYAGVAAGAALQVHGVTSPEWYVATPAVIWLGLGVVAMLRHRAVPSVVLLPALVVGLAPTMSLALGGDSTRQAVLLGVGVVLLAAGAQWRLATPLYTGAVVVSVITLRIVGPHIVALPRWSTLGTAGVVLLLLGATWERRLADARQLADRVRPQIATLR